LSLELLDTEPVRCGDLRSGTVVVEPPAHFLTTYQLF
jgi:hypothetical protein